MDEIDLYLDFAKDSLSQAACEYFNSEQSMKKIKFFELEGREVKIEADLFFENFIIKKLKTTGLPILSEECGYISGDAKKYQDLLWILDPLDGSLNFSKGIKYSSISLALWKNEKPLFGVIYCLDTKKIFWGGKSIGSYSNESKINSSDVNDIENAILCTGFPSRFNMNLESSFKSFYNILKKFRKIRMIGSASSSLILLARGCVDAYFEERIMLWDVAAGIAIAEGAGSSFSMKSAGDTDYCYNVKVANQSIMKEIRLDG